MHTRARAVVFIAAICCLLIAGAGYVRPFLLEAARLTGQKMGRPKLRRSTRRGAPGPAAGGGRADSDPYSEPGPSLDTNRILLPSESNRPAPKPPLPRHEPGRRSGRGCGRPAIAARAIVVGFTVSAGASGATVAPFDYQARAPLARRPAWLLSVTNPPGQALPLETQWSSAD